MSLARISELFPKYRAYFNPNPYDACVESMSTAKEEGKVLYKFFRDAVLGDMWKTDHDVEELVKSCITHKDRVSGKYRVEFEKIQHVFEEGMIGKQLVPASAAVPSSSMWTTALAIAHEEVRPVHAGPAEASIGARNITEDPRALNPPMNFSQEFWGNDTYEYYDSKLFQYDLLIDMIRSNTEPFKTVMLKTMLLVELKKEEARSFACLKSWDESILSTDLSPQDRENINKAALSKKRYIMELQRAEHFTQ